MNKIFISLIVVLAFSTYTKAAESETPYTDEMLKYLFELKLNSDKYKNQLFGSFLTEDDLEIITFLGESHVRREWVVDKHPSSNNPNYIVLLIKEQPYWNSGSSCSHGRTDFGKALGDLVEEGKNDATLVEKHFKCYQNNGLLTCSFWFSKKEFREKFEQYKEAKNGSK